MELTVYMGICLLIMVSVPFFMWIVKKYSSVEYSNLGKYITILNGCFQNGSYIALKNQNKREWMKITIGKNDLQEDTVNISILENFYYKIPVKKRTSYGEQNIQKYFYNKDQLDEKVFFPIITVQKTRDVGEDLERIIMGIVHDLNGIVGNKAYIFFHGERFPGSYALEAYWSEYVKKKSREDNNEDEGEKKLG